MVVSRMAIKCGLRKLTPLKLGPLRQLETFSFIQHPEPARCGDCTDWGGESQVSFDLISLGTFLPQIVLSP